MYLVPTNYNLFRRPEPLSPFWRRNMLDDYFPAQYLEEEVRDSTWNPPMDFIDDKDKYLLFVDAPGMNKEDIQINFKEGILFVEGKRAHEKEVGNGDNVKYLLERRCGSFRRHFHLHVDIDLDNLRADYSNGILKVMIPKSRETGTRSIPIETS